MSAIISAYVQQWFHSDHLYFPDSVHEYERERRFHEAQDIAIHQVSESSMQENMQNQKKNTFKLWFLKQWYFHSDLDFLIFKNIYLFRSY